MALHKIISKNTAAQTSTYVGDKGELFFDPENPKLKASDGVTPGGVSLESTIMETSIGTTRTLTVEDAAKLIVIGSTGTTLTVPANAAVPFPIGTLISIATLTDSATISGPGGVSLYNASTGTNSATYTMAARSLASLLKVGTNLWYVSGSNLS